MADFRRYPFADHDSGEDGGEDDGNLCPAEFHDLGIQLQPDAAGTDQPDHGRFTDIDVSTEHADTSESGHDLRHDAVGQGLRTAGAGHSDGFDLGRVDLLDRLIQQLGA